MIRDGGEVETGDARRARPRRAGFPFGHTAAQLRGIAGPPHDRTCNFEVWRRVHVKHFHRVAGQDACDVSAALRIYEDAGTILGFPPPEVVDIAEWNQCLGEVLQEARAPLPSSLPWITQHLPRARRRAFSGCSQSVCQKKPCSWAS